MSWSFSRLKNFLQCPRQYYELKVAKSVPQGPETDAMRYGTEFHEAAEFYIGQGTPLPAKFDYALPTLDKLNSIEGTKYCEYEMGLTEAIEPCAFDADDVWFRGIADLLIVNEDTGVTSSFDYKTGRNTAYADTGQLELMALAIFKHFPKTEVVKSALLFVVPDEIIKETYHVDDAPKLWRKWLTKYSQLEKAHKNNVWNPNPSGLCRRHCAVITCPHNGLS